MEQEQPAQPQKPTIKQLREELLKIYLRNEMNSAAQDIMGMTILQYILAVEDKKYDWPSYCVPEGSKIEPDHNILLWTDAAIDFEYIVMINSDDDCQDLVNYVTASIDNLVNDTNDSCKLIAGSLRLITCPDQVYLQALLYKT